MPFRDNSRHLWKVWQAIVRTSVVREMEFRTNFFLGIIREFSWLVFFTFNIEVIFQHTTTLAGWEKPEVLIILAFSRLVEGAMQTLFISNVMDIPNTIQQGKFDLILVKPLPAQWQAAFKKVTIYNIGNVLAGIALLIYTLIRYPFQLSLTSVVATVLLSLLGVVAYYSVLIIFASLGFWLERFQAIWAINYLISEPLTVPLDVFPRSVRLALTYLLPAALVVFIPAQALTGRLVWWQIPIAILIAIIFLTLANIVWRAGLRRYSSASS